MRSAAALPPVDNLTIDNMDDLPDVADYSDVSLLSKTLIEFLLTRYVTFRCLASRDVTITCHCLT